MDVGRHLCLRGLCLKHTTTFQFMDLLPDVTSLLFYHIYLGCSSGLQFGEGWDPSGYVIMQRYSRKIWEEPRCSYDGLFFGNPGCLSRRFSSSVNINRQRQHCLQLLSNALWTKKLCQLLKFHRRPGELFQGTVMKERHRAILVNWLLGFADVAHSLKNYFQKPVIILLLLHIFLGLNGNDLAFILLQL